MQTVEYAHILQTIIDANRYSKLIASVGNQLNDRKDRFDKADIIEQSLEVYTNGRLQWVDDIGRDHHDVETGLDLEFKYMANGLFTKTGKSKATIKVKLKNSLGKSKGVEIDNPADFYVLGQQDSIAIISGTDIKQYLVAVPDGIEAHIPFDAVEFAFQKVKPEFLVEVSYKEQKRAMQRELIESI
jgi:hypothetical protein